MAAKNVLNYTLFQKYSFNKDTLWECAFFVHFFHVKLGKEGNFFSCVKAKSINFRTDSFRMMHFISHTVRMKSTKNIGNTFTVFRLGGTFSI